MDQFNKQVVCLLGDHNELIKQKLLAFEGGMHQYNFLLQMEQQKSQHNMCGVLKMSWLNKLLTYPAVVVFIYDLTEPERLDKLLESYNQIKNLTSLNKKFKPSLVVMLVGKNVQSIDFGFIKKDIDFRKVIVIDMDNVGGVLKRLKKMIVEDSITFYEDLYSKYKENSHKLQKTDLSDQKLLFEIKKHLISEVTANQKRSLKHLSTAYQIALTLSQQRKEQNISDDKNIAECYELVLQVEEYRAIADELRFKLFRNMEANEIINQFDIHYKSLRNLIQSQHFVIQEYVWRVQLFIRLVKFLELRLPTISQIVVFNYFQCILQNYLHLQQLPKECNLKDYAVLRLNPEYLGRANYVVKQGDEIIEIKSENKLQLYELIIQYRKTEAQNIPKVDFLFQLWRSYTEGQETYGALYMNYLQMLITQNFENRQQITQKMLKFSMFSEARHLVQMEMMATTDPARLIKLNAELLASEESRIDNIFQLASELQEPIHVVLQINKCVVFERIEGKLIRMRYNLTSKLLNLLTKGELLHKDGTLEFLVGDDCQMNLEKSILKPASVKLYGGYKQLTLEIQANEVEFLSNGFSVDGLHVSKPDPPQFILLKTHAFINEINELPFKLSAPADISLLNYSLEEGRILKFKNIEGSTWNSCTQGVILISDLLVYEKVLELSINGEATFVSVELKFPFTYKLLVKSLDSVYKNAQNRNREVLIANSRSVVQLQVSGVKVLDASFKGKTDLELENPNRLNVFFRTKEAAIYENFGTFTVNYERSGMRYQAKVQVKNLQVINSGYNVRISAPAECKAAVPFEMKVKIETAESSIFFVQLKDQEKKHFFIHGMVKQYLIIEKESEIVYQMFPIETGRCNLPGVVVELRKKNEPYQLVFDSTGMKSIYVMP